MAPAFGATREEYGTLWKNMALRPGWVRAVQREAQRILPYRERYQKVSAATHVPWFVIGLIHSMESGLDFNTHLHNGDPLTERTVHVPRGRPVTGNPPFTWEESAIDALQNDNVADVANWCVEQIAFTLEAYNGWGYRYKQLPSPYLWSGTNNYTRGKYVRDGQFDPNAVSEQTGALAILSVMRDLDPSIELTYFDGTNAAHEPQTPILPPAGAVVAKPKSTIASDTLTVVSAVGATAVAVSHTATPPTTVTPPAATTAPPPTTTTASPPAAATTPPPATTTPSPVTTTTPSPAATSTTTPSGTTAPATTGAKPSQPVPHPATTTTGTAQPVHPQPTLIDTYYPVILGSLLIVFVIGLYFSWKARSGRASSAERFTSAVPQLLSRAASGSDISSAPLVRSLRARLLTVAWIAVTIVVNAIALAKLLQYFNLAPADWYPPFSTLGNVYDVLARQGFTVLVNFSHAQFNIDLSKWPWLVPFAVIYVSTASAFLVANSGLMRRDTSAETLWGAVVHAGWLLAIPAFILDALRYRIVARFARQNTVLFFAYIAAFAFGYIGARFINDDFLAPYTRQNPNVAVVIEHVVQTGVNPLVAASKN